MDTYTLFRQIADSWVLLMMFGFFVGAIAFAFRPGSRAAQAEAASAIFTDAELSPAPRAGTTAAPAISPTAMAPTAPAPPGGRSSERQ